MATLSINTIGNSDYFLNEAYKTLRTNIELCGSDTKVIALTSCTPQEGKSSVSLNLAVSLAEAGKKVLLLDCDLRNSVLVGRIKLEEGKLFGVTQFLAGQCTANDIICSTNVSKLQVAVAGMVPPNPAELLGGKRFEQFLSSAREIYDYILIDTAPLGAVIDCAIIARQCDGAAFVIESDAISYRFAQNVKAQLDKTECKLLGVILNKVSMDKGGQYGKYGKYGSYGKYGKYGRYGAYGKYGAQYGSTPSENTVIKKD